MQVLVITAAGGKNLFLTLICGLTSVHIFGQIGNAQTTITYLMFISYYPLLIAADDMWYVISKSITNSKKLNRPIDSLL